MEAAIIAALATLPNLAIAVWVIFSNQKTIGTLLENQQKLIEQLMALKRSPADADK